MKEIMAMTDGSPIYPVNWKYFDETHYDIQSSKAKAVIIDPANPRDNLGKKLSLEDLKQIRSLASKKIHSLC
jgi:HD superfamily phosphodiesterase